MGNSKAELEQLKKLEDEAYNELCQIIAEAMQIQDVNLLDQKINNWKRKYKKLLDSSSPSSANFKKRIEYLLNQFYSEITQYILKQIKKNEEKRIENQSKALKKLHKIIEETNDLSLLKEKVKEWESKYPMSGFLDMYKRRINIYTSEKYLKDHAFDQDKAFYDLYYITKLNRTFDGFKEELKKWEDTYSIHDKFELEDFIKNRTEVRRYTSDEYLISIAREDNIDSQDFISPEKDIVASYETSSDSSLEKQASAYAHLISIAKKANNTDEIFEWVYKNNSIKFNDKYKNLILSAVYLDYSPTYLNALSVPKIDLSNSLSFEEYKNIDEIKKYTVISYFNLLLPPDRRIPNNYFNEHIEKIYRKSRTARFSNEYNEIDKLLGENAEIKSSPTKTETPELEIDISVGQVFSITNDIVTSEKVIEENISTVAEESQPASSENTPKVEKKADQTTSSVKNILIEETPKQPEGDPLTAQATVKVKCEEPVSEKIKAKHSDDISSTAVVPEAMSSPNDYESKEVTRTAEIDTTQTLDSTSSNEIGPEKVQSEPVIATDESKLVVPEVNEKLQYENQNISKKSSETTTVEFVETTEELKTQVVNSSPQVEEQDETLSNDTIIALSPSFFEIMNNKVNMQEQRATIVTMIDTHVENYMSIATDKTTDISKTRVDSN